MKRIVSSVIMGLTLVGAMATQTYALSLDYANVSGATLVFNAGPNTFSFDPTPGTDFEITSVTGGSDPQTVGLFGSIGGTFTIGAISSPAANLETAPVTGTGSFSIVDENGVPLTATLSWVSISTFGSTGGINGQAVLNLTGISYAGSNTDLLTFLGPPSGGIATATFQFNPARSLTDLTTGTATVSTSHSGSVAPVPEPASLLFLGLALAGLGIWRRKSTQA